jgi:hypothetical protein
MNLVIAAQPNLLGSVSCAQNNLNKNCVYFSKNFSSFRNKLIKFAVYFGVSTVSFTLGINLVAHSV